MLVYAVIAVAILIWVAVIAIWLIDAIRGGPDPIMVAIANAIFPPNSVSIEAPLLQGLHAPDPTALQSPGRPIDAAPAKEPSQRIRPNPLPAPHSLLISDSERV